MLGGWVIRPIDPASQRIILNIVGFLVTYLLAFWGNEKGGISIFQKHIIHVLLKSPIALVAKSKTHQQEMSEYTQWAETNSEWALLFYANALSQEISCNFHAKYDVHIKRFWNNSPRD